MKCPFCAHAEDRVVDSRESKEGEAIRRRRECLACGKRFTTYERLDEIPYMVVKKDGRREKFDRQKLLTGLLHAAEKRPISTTQLEAIVNEAESLIAESPERELATRALGELLMDRLRHLDKVAYVRFASVYMDFKNVNEFLTELNRLMGRQLEDVLGGGPQPRSPMETRTTRPKEASLHVPARPQPPRPTAEPASESRPRPRTKEPPPS